MNWSLCLGLGLFFILTSYLFCDATQGPEFVLDLARDASDNYQISGNFLVKAQAQTVWQVLTDYAHIADYVQDMRVSKLIKRTRDYILIEQSTDNNFTRLVNQC